MAAVSQERFAYPLARYKAVLLALGLTFALFWSLTLLAGAWPLAVLFGAVALMVFLVARPLEGFYALLASVLIIEGSSGLTFVRDASQMYRGLHHLVGPGLPPISPVELAMGLLILGTVLKVRGEGERLRYGDIWWPLLVVAATTLYGLWRGFNSGGDWVIGYHEVRGLMYLLPIYFLTVNLLRERHHYSLLAVVVVLASSAMAVGALHTHLTLVRPGLFVGSLDLGFAHENAVFAGLVVILMAAMAVWGRGLGPRVILIAPGILALSAILVMKRRIGVIALDAGLVLLAIVLLRNNWRAFLMWMPILVVLAVLYLSAYWNATGGLGQGARAFRTVIGQEAAAEDISSKIYRDNEAYNVESNIRWQPFWGLGFGKPYPMPAPLPDLTRFWPFQPYIPHNTILWTWMKGGIMAYIPVLALFGFAMMRGMALARRRMEPLLRAWSIAAPAFVLMVFLFSWHDLGLTSLRTMIMFGLSLGLIVSLAAIPEAEPEPPPAETWPRPHAATLAP